MTPGTAKAKGRQTEQAVVEYLSRWSPYVERRRLEGVADRGDIAGIPGWVLEVKSAGGGVKPTPWLNELAVEMENAGVERGAVVMRRKGRPNAEDFVAMMPLPMLVALMQDAGWLPGADDELDAGVSGDVLPAAGV